MSSLLLLKIISAAQVWRDPNPLPKRTVWGPLGAVVAKSGHMRSYLTRGSRPSAQPQSQPEAFQALISVPLLPKRSTIGHRPGQIGSWAVYTAPLIVSTVMIRCRPYKHCPFWPLCSSCSSPTPGYIPTNPYSSHTTSPPIPDQPSSYSDPIDSSCPPPRHTESTQARLSA